MTLWTLDEGWEAVVTSARSVLDHASCEPHDRYFLLWGAGRIEGLDPTDQALGLVIDLPLAQQFAWALAGGARGCPCREHPVLVFRPRAHGHGGALRRSD
jgi:hypothetical protein